MFTWDLRDVMTMRVNAPCEDRKCMKDAFHREVWNARDVELEWGTDKKVMNTVLAYVRTSVADEAVFEVVL